MRVFNIMMSRDLGGIQQAYLDYSEALKMHNHEVINISSMNAKINQLLQSNHTLPNIGQWCIFSKILLRILIVFYKPKVIICHGNRAINFAKAFKQRNSIIIGVSHNYSYKYLKKCCQSNFIKVELSSAPFIVLHSTQQLTQLLSSYPLLLSIRSMPLKPLS